MFFFSVPDTCSKYNTSEKCVENECTWCGGACVTMKTSCPPVMGNGIVDGCEECDDGNLIDGDGCSAEGRKESSAFGVRSNTIISFITAFICGLFY